MTQHQPDPHGHPEQPDQPHQHSHHGHHGEDPYDRDTPMWSGNPNGGLVDVVSSLTPGRALDIGSGEGADVVWLAQQGWDATGLEPSSKALERARAASEKAGVEVEWLQGLLADAPLDGGRYDLVSLCYPALDKTPQRINEQAALALVATGGHLLVLMHADVDRERALAHGFDPDTRVDADDIRAAVTDAGWRLVVDERRARHVTGGEGAHHDTDIVLLAQRP